MRKVAELLPKSTIKLGRIAELLREGWFQREESDGHSSLHSGTWLEKLIETPPLKEDTSSSR